MVFIKQPSDMCGSRGISAWRDNWNLAWVCWFDEWGVGQVVVVELDLEIIDAVKHRNDFDFWKCWVWESFHDGFRISRHGKEIGCERSRG